jgi:hypothetical protein
VSASTLDGPRLWSTSLTTALDEVGGRIDAVARRLADAWPDARGDDWVHRLQVLRRAVERDADAAAEFGRAVDRLAGHDLGPIPDGPRLGGTAAVRVGDRRGVTIPQLNDPLGG